MDLKMLNFENPNFKNWFSGSKIVDQYGVPLVLFHGTDMDFNTFLLEFKGKNTGWNNTIHGFYFLENKTLCENFVKENNRGGSVVIKEVFLSIKNPFDLRREQFFTLGKQAVDVVEYLTSERLDEPEALNWLDDEIGIAEYLELPDTIDTKEFNDFLISRGYDGVLSEFGDCNTQYVAFYPNQIKSACGNNGEFSLFDDDITK